MPPWITIVVVAHERLLHLPIIIHSFLVQTEPHWEMVILHDGPNDAHANLAAPYTAQYPNIRYGQSSKRHNDFGHPLREWALNEWVRTEWVCLTNDDNYYMPTFLKECNTVIADNASAEFIMVDAVMNIPVENSNRFNAYQTQYTYPKTSHIDMGSFIAKTKRLQDLGLNNKTEYSDGIMVESLINNHPNAQAFKINQTLFVYN
jgi:hypothetical protein